MPRTATRPATASPRERLTRDAVVTAALELADHEGLEAVTIRRLATETGVTPMALYWHVKDKDELLQAIGERLFTEVELPPLSRRAWHTQLQAALAALLAPLRRHPAAAILALTTVLESDAGLVVAERVLSLLSDGGYGPEEAAETGRYLLSALVALVTTDPDGDGPETDATIAGVTARLKALSRERFPHVVQMAAPLAACSSEDSYYGRGIDLLVHGTKGLARS